MHEIVNQDTYIIVTDGFDVIHGPIHSGNDQITTTGQPFMVLAPSEAEVIDLYFSEYTVDEETDEITYVQRDIVWTVEYTEEDALTICDLVSTIADYLLIQPIKHPQRDEWAVPVQEYIFGLLPPGPEKTALEQQAQASIAAGRRKTAQEMTEGGWV